MPSELVAVPAPRVLYLEDDDDVRELMSELLRDSGYDITACATAEAALAQIRASELDGAMRYELLLSDFMLPKHNADWLLASAKAEGLLKETPVIILSSENNPPGIGDIQFLRKPVDVGLLLGHIARALEPAAPPQPVGEARISLRLYVSASVESLKAERHLRKLLNTIDPRSGRPLHDLVRLAVFDVTEPSDALFEAIEADRVIVTPTLIRRAPAPYAAFLGDLSRRGVVENMLRDALELNHASGPAPPAAPKPKVPA